MQATVNCESSWPNRDAVNRFRETVQLICGIDAVLAWDVHMNTILCVLESIKSRVESVDKYILLYHSPRFSINFAYQLPFTIGVIFFGSLPTLGFIISCYLCVIYDLVKTNSRMWCIDLNCRFLKCLIEINVFSTASVNREPFWAQKTKAQS